MNSIREVTTDADLDSALAIRNESLYYGPFTRAEFLDLVSRDPEKILARRLIREDDRDTAYGVQSIWQIQEPGVVSTVIHYRTLSGFIELYRNLEALARERGAYRQIVWIRSVHTDALDFLAVEGFQETQRQFESRLLLAELNQELWPILDRCLASGYELLSLAEVISRFPNDWQYRAWRIEMDLFHDVPMPEPYEEIPFESFKRQLESPELNRDAAYYALKDGHLVGTSQLLPNKLDPRLAGTGLTGVSREHRRRGVATALKLASFRYALGSGIEEIYSDNEKSNPMYQINLSLGFKYVWDWVCLAKPLTVLADS